MAALQQLLIDAIEGTPLGDAELLNPPGPGPQARFLAFRSPHSQRWYEELKARNCIVDVRNDVLRIGLGLYHDESDIDALASLAGELR